ncbi:hypothetical protein M438DRAFT_285705, partial [Aureobasidium pullulans EXF-150]
NLLKIVISKSSLLEGIFLSPIATILYSLKGVINTLAFSIIDSIPFYTNKATLDKSNLDDTLSKAVYAYTPTSSLGLNLFC